MLPDNPYPASPRVAGLLPHGARPPHGDQTVPPHIRAGARRLGCELAAPYRGPERSVMWVNAVRVATLAWFDGFLLLDRLMIIVW